MADISALPEWHVMLVPKAGSSDEECEDAGFVWPGDPHIDDEGRITRSLYAAVSDGASESLLAGAWAERLTRDAVESMTLTGDWWQDPGAFVGDFMGRSADRWDAYLARYQVERAARGRPITWYEQPGLEKGAFATVLGAEVRAFVADDGRTNWSWHAFALGDSCLFHMRDGYVREAFPLGSFEDFGITPQLLGSRNRDVALVTDRVTVAHGVLVPGDELVLASDALAAWLLSSHAESHPPGDQLGKLTELGQKRFADWVEDQRGRAHMRNDDVTLIRIRT
ncbi:MULTISPECIES: hypothetical protein [Streptomyces]|uniref:hypothetical protein n=1 Tax=Streptomyces TaxID=1883 RepID=UPI000BD30301|nr:MULTISPECIES: hypothetical protein [unclassified Streptomyces]NMI59077.1 hypothetical protein [Streptomyces sp. RLA2-12]QDN58356.1 hypothetical protein FNV67_26240 [Streptomyces sp. S1D4-20]QDN68450.1 hypothetical protein FNV66_25430 [Streptomyces sp. S1D4-14]QDO50868.1 hypothetical protein FNV60_23695 [Streptomyces sp. RLB3-5]QDO61107.1 hypothetical protein FNV59_25935 [Streptomyces sp. RLB1-8]